MSKLLVNTPSGAQEIIEVGEGGGYFDTARVLWDEREDGKLPTLTLGGMVRTGGTLVFDQARMDEHTAALNPPTPVPTSCTPAQGLVALFAVKQITEDQLLAAIDQIPDEVQRYTAKIGLQRATTWERTSPTMQAMAALLGLTEQDLDDLYTLAVTVVV